MQLRLGAGPGIHSGEAATSLILNPQPIAQSYVSALVAYPDLQKLDLARPHTFRAVGPASKGKAHSAAIVGYAYLPPKACTAPADH